MGPSQGLEGPLLPEGGGGGGGVGGQGRVVVFIHAHIETYTQTINMYLSISSCRDSSRNFLNILTVFMGEEEDGEGCCLVIADRELRREAVKLV